MPSTREPYESEIDEYMWPLTGEATAFNWTALAEQLEIRQRLGEILAHVRDMHIAPRQRRLGPRPSPDMIRAVEESVMDGPAHGPVWAQTLKEPVPRALRDEWHELTRRLREIERRAAQPAAGDR
jgi:hypothetical protein